jgi:chitinase
MRDGVVQESMFISSSSLEMNTLSRNTLLLPTKFRPKLTSIRYFRCNNFYPEQIPLGIYSHINFAFATVDPATFAVIPNAITDPTMYKRLTDLKKLDPSLQIFISIGGWTFNDVGTPTEFVFSDLSRSEASQNKFIASLIQFMSLYNFDGLDLDWEYPVAPDRSGRPEDFENFPKFMAKLKGALKGTGREGLTVTLPASYWYLKNFDLTALEPHVDWYVPYVR